MTKFKKGLNLKIVIFVLALSLACPLSGFCLRAPINSEKNAEAMLGLIYNDVGRNLSTEEALDYLRFNKSGKTRVYTLGGGRKDYSNIMLQIPVEYGYAVISRLKSPVFEKSSGKWISLVALMTYKRNIPLWQISSKTQYEILSDIPSLLRMMPSLASRENLEPVLEMLKDDINHNSITIKAVSAFVRARKGLFSYIFEYLDRYAHADEYDNRDLKTKVRKIKTEIIYYTLEPELTKSERWVDRAGRRIIRSWIYLQLITNHSVDLAGLLDTLNKRVVPAVRIIGHMGKDAPKLGYKISNNKSDKNMQDEHIEDPSIIWWLFKDSMDTEGHEPEDSAQEDLRDDLIRYSSIGEPILQNTGMIKPAADEYLREIVNISRTINNIKTSTSVQVKPFSFPLMLLDFVLIDQLEAGEVPYYVYEITNGLGYKDLFIDELFDRNNVYRLRDKNFLFRYMIRSVSTIYYAAALNGNKKSENAQVYEQSIDELHLFLFNEIGELIDIKDFNILMHKEPYEEVGRNKIIKKISAEISRNKDFGVGLWNIFVRSFDKIAEEYKKNHYYPDVSGEIILSFLDKKGPFIPGENELLTEFYGGELTDNKIEEILWILSETGSFESYKAIESLLKNPDTERIKKVCEEALEIMESRGILAGQFKVLRKTAPRDKL